MFLSILFLLFLEFGCFGFWEDVGTSPSQEVNLDPLRSRRSALRLALARAGAALPQFHEGGRDGADLRPCLDLLCKNSLDINKSLK